MDIIEYLRQKIAIGKQPDLELIYEELMNLGYPHEQIYLEINEVILENINKIIDEYKKKKGELDE